MNRFGRIGTAVLMGALTLCSSEQAFAEDGSASQRWSVYGVMHPSHTDAPTLSAVSVNTVFGSPQVTTAAAVRSWLDSWHEQGFGAILAFGSSYLKQPGTGAFDLSKATSFWQPILGGETNAEIRAHPALRGVMVLDEPYDASNWGGTRLEKSDLMNVYQAFKAIAPEVPMGVGMGDAGVFAEYAYMAGPVGSFLDFGSFTFTQRKDQIFGGFSNYMSAGRETALADWVSHQPEMQIYLMPQAYGMTGAQPPIPMPSAAWLMETVTGATDYTIHGIIFNTWNNNKYTNTLGEYVNAELAYGQPGPYGNILINGAAVPEPSTLGLLGVGSMTVLLRRRCTKVRRVRNRPGVRDGRAC